MNLHRQYKLSKMVSIDPKLAEFFAMFDSVMLGLKKFEIVKYPDWVFYMNVDGDNILQYEPSTSDLYVRYYGFMESSASMYGFRQTGIKNLIESVLLEHYGINSCQMYNIKSCNIDRGFVEKEYKKFSNI